MRRLTVVMLAALLLAGAPAASAGTAPVQPATGAFTATIDFSSLSLTPIGSQCLLSVEGMLVFTGTLSGTADGTTSALVQASCADVGAYPPGTFTDVFRANLTFSGSLDGAPVAASMVYQGRTEVGGSIGGLILLSDGLRGALQVDGIVAIGGSYDGRVGQT